MYSKTHDLILTAWRENCLAAVHIHPQTHYAGENHKVFIHIARLARFLRKIDVTNIWTADPDYSEGLTTVASFNAACRNPRYALATKAGYKNTETAVLKKSFSVFQESENDRADLEIYLQKQSIDTVLVTGVYADVCVQESLESGLKNKNLTLVAVTDCINEPRSGYLAAALIDKRPATGPLHFTSSKEIRNCIEPFTI